MRTPHLACHRGKRVVIILKSGDRIEDTFEEKKDKFVVLRSGRRVLCRTIRALWMPKGGK